MFFFQIIWLCIRCARNCENRRTFLYHKVDVVLFIKVLFVTNKLLIDTVNKSDKLPYTLILLRIASILNRLVNESRPRACMIVWIYMPNALTCKSSEHKTLGGVTTPAIQRVRNWLCCAVIKIVYYVWLNFWLVTKSLYFN